MPLSGRCRQCDQFLDMVQDDAGNWCCPLCGTVFMTAAPPEPDYGMAF